MERFNTLLLREWLQHRRGWMVVAALPSLLLLAVGLSGHAHVQINDGEPLETPLPVAGGIIAVAMLLTLALAWGVALLQSPGLARRDTQDRSIEFWLSLPVGHVHSVSATLLAHLLLLPWAAIAIGLVAGIGVSMLVVVAMFGLGAFATVPWLAVLTAALALALRLVLGVLLATVWMSPLILLPMAASAWLKRWGVPLVAGVVIVGGNVLARVYDNPVVWTVLQTLSTGAGRSLLGADRHGGPTLRGEGDVDLVLSRVPAWALHDAGAAVAQLASPAVPAALLVAAGAFALLVWRRSRST